MNSTILKTALLGITAVAIALSPMAGRAQETKKEAPAEKPEKEKKEAPAGEKSQRATPFRGKIDAIDKTAKTVKVGERVFQINSETRIMKAGKPATLDDAAVGEEVGGTYRKGENGALNASSLRIGPRPEGSGEKSAKEKKTKKEKE